MHQLISKRDGQMTTSFACHRTRDAAVRAWSLVTRTVGYMVT